MEILVGFRQLVQFGGQIQSSFRAAAVVEMDRARMAGRQCVPSDTHERRQTGAIANQQHCLISAPRLIKAIAGRPLDAKMIAGL